MVVVSSSFSAPGEGIIMQSPSTKLFLNDQELGTGTLYITESNVVWGGGVSNNGIPSPSISLMYPTIAMHAIQREPRPSLFMVLNYELRLSDQTQQASDNANEDDDDDDDYDAEEHPSTQLKFIPQNEGDIQQLYSAMNQGQALHPDPADEVDEDDNYVDGEEFDEEIVPGDDEFEDAEESEATPAERMRHLRLDNTNGGYFEDCEDAEIVED